MWRFMLGSPAAAAQPAGAEERLQGLPRESDPVGPVKGGCWLTFVRPGVSVAANFAGS